MSISNNWDTSYEASPAGSDSPTAGDNRIRELKQDIRQRGEREHIWGLSDTQSKHGWHREGSARAFVESQSTLTDYNDTDGTSIGGDAELDDGRLLFDKSQAYIPYVYESGAWLPYIREIARVSIQGTLAADTNVVPPILFPRPCTIKKISAVVGTVPQGEDLYVDFNLDGSTTIFSAADARLKIDDGDSQGNVTTGMTGATLAADAYLTVDLDQVGSVAAANLSMTIETVVG